MVSKQGLNQPEKRNAMDIVFIVLICILGLVAFLPALQGHFLWDDYFHLKNLDALSLSNFWQAYGIGRDYSDQMLFWWSPEFLIKYFRPLSTLLMYVDYKIWHLNPFGYHLTNVCLHIGVSVLVYQTGRVLFENRLLTFFVALLFVLHPAHSEAVNWISGRADLLVGFFAILSFYCFLLHKESKRTISSYYIGSIFAFVMALGSKETGAIIPIIFISYDILHIQNPLEVQLFIKKKLKYHIPFFGILIVYLVFRAIYFESIGTLPEPYFYPPFHPEFLYRVVTNAIYYTSNLLLLYPLSSFDLKQFTETPLLYFVITGVIGILGFLAAYFQRRNRLMYFFLAWSILSILPLISLRYYQRLLYLPSIGFCFFIGMAIRQHFVNLKDKIDYKTGLQFMVAGILILYLFTNYFSSMVFKEFTNLSQSTLSQVKPHLEKSEAMNDPSLTGGRELYFIDINMAESIGFDSAVKLFFNDRSLNASVLTIAPRLFPSFKESDENSPLGLRWVTKILPYWKSNVDSFVEPVDEYSFKLVLKEGNYLGPADENITILSSRPLKEGDRVETKAFDVEIVKMDKNGIKALVFKFKKKLNDPSQLFFHVDGLTVKKLDF